MAIYKFDGNETKQMHKQISWMVLFAKDYKDMWKILRFVENYKLTLWSFVNVCIISESVYATFMVFLFF